uniref:Uncharacterized protein n=1 Tax=Panagrolaimus davidi TaxID=227884 RepID=A0A914PDZ5_9BILA
MYRFTFELSGQQYRVRWFFALDCEDSVFADAVNEECRQLNLDNNFEIVVYETSKFDNKQPISRLLQQDEFVEPDKKYVIVERTFYDNDPNDAEALIYNFSSTQCLSPPRQTSSASIRQSPPASVRQNGPNDAETLTYSCSSTPSLSVSARPSNNEPPLLCTPPRQPPVFHPSINSRQHESATLPETSSMVLDNTLSPHNNVSVSRAAESENYTPR